MDCRVKKWIRVICCEEVLERNVRITNITNIGIVYNIKALSLKTRCNIIIENYEKMKILYKTSENKYGIMK